MNLSGFDAGLTGSTRDLMPMLGADSVSHYQFAHFTNIDRDYSLILSDVEKEWTRIEQEYTCLYFPPIFRWAGTTIPAFSAFAEGL